MMGYTDRHFRVLMRMLAPQALIYTQMLTDEALIRAQSYTQLFGIDHQLGGVVLQLGGCCPERLAMAARIAESYGYDAINLNVGCPSKKVQLANMGACLFKTPDIVARCLEAMKKVINIPITVKTRIGVDDWDQFEHAVDFIKPVLAAGCDGFIIHARKAWLKGLNPAQNRSIPKLNYARVLALQQYFSKVHMVINGGIYHYDQGIHWLQNFPQIMVGRQAPRQPQLIAQLAVQSDGPVKCAPTLIKYLKYVEQQLSSTPVHHMLRHCLGLYQGYPAARYWRTKVNESMCQGGGSRLILMHSSVLQINMTNTYKRFKRVEFCQYLSNFRLLPLQYFFTKWVLLKR